MRRSLRAGSGRSWARECRRSDDRGIQKRSRLENTGRSARSCPAGPYSLHSGDPPESSPRADWRSRSRWAAVRQPISPPYFPDRARARPPPRRWSVRVRQPSPHYACESPSAPGPGPGLAPPSRPESARQPHRAPYPRGRRIPGRRPPEPPASPHSGLEAAIPTAKTAVRTGRAECRCGWHGRPHPPRNIRATSCADDEPLPERWNRASGRNQADVPGLPPRCCIP